MKLDNMKNILVSKQELYVIARALVEFSQETHWALNIAGKKEIFKKEFEKKFAFSLSTLDSFMRKVNDLNRNNRCNNIISILLVLSKEIKKGIMIYTALNECSKNFEDYEISTRVGITKEELYRVLNDFKKLFPEIESK